MRPLVPLLVLVAAQGLAQALPTTGAWSDTMTWRVRHATVREFVDEVAKQLSLPLRATHPDLAHRKVTLYSAGRPAHETLARMAGGLGLAWRLDEQGQWRLQPIAGLRAQEEAWKAARRREARQEITDRLAAAHRWLQLPAHERDRLTLRWQAAGGDPLDHPSPDGVWLFLATLNLLDPIQIERLASGQELQWTPSVEAAERGWAWIRPPTERLPAIPEGAFTHASVTVSVGRRLRNLAFSFRRWGGGGQQSYEALGTLEPAWPAEPLPPAFSASVAERFFERATKQSQPFPYPFGTVGDSDVLLWLGESMGIPILVEGMRTLEAVSHAGTTSVEGWIADIKEGTVPMTFTSSGEWLLARPVFVLFRREIEPPESALRPIETAPAPDLPAILGLWGAMRRWDRDLRYSVSGLVSWDDLPKLRQAFSFLEKLDRAQLESAVKGDPIRFSALNPEQRLFFTSVLHSGSRSDLARSSPEELLFYLEALGEEGAMARDGRRTVTGGINDGVEGTQPSADRPQTVRAARIFHFNFYFGTSFQESVRHSLRIVWPSPGANVPIRVVSPRDEGRPQHEGTGPGEPPK